MKCYMMTWHLFSMRRAVSRADLLNRLDNINVVRNWRASQGTVFMVSETDF
jgi:hypothetical protein